MGSYNYTYKLTEIGAVNTPCSKLSTQQKNNHNTYQFVKYAAWTFVLARLSKFRMEEAKESETSSEAKMASESTRGRHLFNSMVDRSKAIARKRAK